MTAGQTDIEIYIKRADLNDILRWLDSHFDIEAQGTAGETTKLSLRFNGQPLTCTVFEKAAKGGYVSVLFEPNATPWINDEACAEEAHTFFGLEVRCVTGGWTTTSEETGGWYRFTESGKTVVNWLT